MASTLRPFDRALAYAFRPFSKVRPEEAATTAVMTLAACILLIAYYLLKTVREPLILLQGGAEMKLYARAGQAVLMAGVVQVYGEVARRVRRMRLLAIVFLFFVSNLVVFAFLSRTPLQIGLLFFLWVGLFSYMSVAQLWALAADIHTEEQGKRLFPIIGIGSSVGAVAGSRLAKSLVGFGPHALMETAAGLLLVCLALLAWVEGRSKGSRGPEPARPTKEAPAEAPLSTEGAFQLLSHDRYLVLIAVMIVLLNWVNSSGEYALDRALLATLGGDSGAAATAAIGAFKADYFAWYNMLGLFLQLFAVSRILTKLGVRNALLFLPVFAFAGYAWAAAVPVLAVFRLVKIGENAIEYSVAETARHSLYLVTSRVEKYVGKTSVDTISVRVGAILSSAVVWVGGRTGLPLWGFAAINVVLGAAWIAVVVLIGRENARRVHEEAFVPVPALS